MLAGDYDDAGGFVADAPDPISLSVELPAVRIRRAALGEVDADWSCPICPLADRSARRDRLPPCIAEFREALDAQPRLLPEVEACRVLSSMFNRTCYARDRERPAGSRAGVSRIEPSDVRAHLEHSRHLRDNEEHMLDDRIWYALRLSEQMEKNGLWFSAARGEAKLDRDGFSDWCKAQEVIKKWVELRHRFHGGIARAPAAAAGGVGKKSGARYHYSRTG